MEFHRAELEQMKRAVLQKLCKLHGVKANMKTTKLIEGLLQCSSKASEEKENTPVSGKQANQNIPEPVVVTKSPESYVVNKDVQQETKNTVQTVPQVAHKKQPVKTVVCENTKENMKVATKIPRLTTGPNSDKAAAKKNARCNTPKVIQNKTPKIGSAPKDWSKIHQKQFDKMASLGEYLEKKRKRAADLTSSVKKIKLSNDSAAKKPVQPQIASNIKPQNAKTPTKATLDEKKKRLTFNFTKSFKENVITPGRAKRRATVGTMKTPTQATQQKPGTPFRFSGATNMNTSLFSPTPRKVFDLKASLAKPLNYKPYTGTLPTRAKQSAKPQSVKLKTAITHERDVKAVKKSRKNRRNEKITKQSKNRSQAACKRRGVAF